jgi:hypothetical protein
MVKLNVSLGDFSEPEEKEIYQILSVESQIRKGFNGVSVVFNPTKPTKETAKISYRATLWVGKSDIIGTQSKLGAFINAFNDFFQTQEDKAGVQLSEKEALETAQDTDKWVGHTIKIVSWREKKRQIEVLS